VHWLFWRSEADGAVIGAEVDRSALLAELLARLPSTDPDDRRDARFVLAEAGRVLYQWGGYSPADGEEPRARRDFGPPLEAWTLEAYAADASPDAAQAAAPVASLAAVLLALAGLAWYLHRESSRELREARERMSFVSQVSHELKTPLTNIRLYAELLERRLPPDDPRARQQLDVVVSESRRLGRLIANVLTFTRAGAAKPLARRTGVVDRIVEAVLAHFEPAFAAAGIAVELRRGASDPVSLDPDAVEQIVGNLLSNAEKYAAAGGYVGIATRREGEVTTIEVRDRGPGIPRDARDKVFQPFVRLSNRLTDGAAGTGIGLTIARGLARQHGGDLVAAPCEEGALFVVTLRTPPASPAPPEAPL
jgi:signal transduction histidine kinase